MNTTFQTARKAKERLKKSLLDDGSRSMYIVSVGVSKVGIKDRNAPVNEKRDYCLFITLREELPNKLALPSQYEGIRVCALVTDEISAS